MIYLSGDLILNIQDRGTWKPQASKKECGTSLNSESIVGGERTKFGDFPFMALLGKVYQKVFVKYIRLKLIGFS